VSFRYQSLTHSQTFPTCRRDRIRSRELRDFGDAVESVLGVVFVRKLLMGVRHEAASRFRSAPQA
jgi:hypothetical protein